MTTPTTESVWGCSYINCSALAPLQPSWRAFDWLLHLVGRIYITVSSTGRDVEMSANPRISHQHYITLSFFSPPADRQQFQASPLSIPYQPLRMDNISRIALSTAQYVPCRIGWGDGLSRSRVGPFNGFHHCAELPRPFPLAKVGGWLQCIHKGASDTRPK